MKIDYRLPLRLKIPKINQSYSLVLGGGGAKGVYQIGVWKALREMGIRINAAYGTSIGSINACFIALGDYKKAVDFYEKLTLENSIIVPESMKNETSIKMGKVFFEQLFSSPSKYALQKGIDTSPLQMRIAEYIDEQKIRKSKIDFGCMTFDLAALKGKAFYLETIPKGRLIDYLMASSAVPGLKEIKIENTRFLDGGLSSVVPHEMAYNRGKRKIICVDISGPGNYKGPEIKLSNLIYIKNSYDLGSMFETSNEILARNLRMGYLDTLKSFELISGYWYYFVDQDNYAVKCNQYLLQEEEKILEAFNRNSKEVKISDLLPPSMKYDTNLFACIVESAARVLQIEEVKLYSLKELVGLIIGKYKHIQANSKKVQELSFSQIIKKVFKNSQNLFELSIIEYEEFLSSFLNLDSKPHLIGEAFKGFVPELLAAKLFFMLVDQGVVR